MVLFRGPHGLIAFGANTLVTVVDTTTLKVSLETFTFRIRGFCKFLAGILRTTFTGTLDGT